MITDQSAAERPLTLREKLERAGPIALPEPYASLIEAERAAIEAAVLADARARVEALPTHGAYRVDMPGDRAVMLAAVLEALDPPR